MADPLAMSQLFQSAVLEHQANRLEQAEVLYRRVLALQPDHADALHLLGVLFNQTGRPAEALDLIDRALMHDPNNAHYLADLGLVLAAMGRHDQAVIAYRKALSIGPNPETYYNLGNALRFNQDLGGAIDAYRQALGLRADFVEACNNLAQTLHENHRLDDAIATYRRALTIRPSSPEALKNLGNAIKEAGELDEAIDCYRQASSLAGDARTASNLLYAIHFHPAYGPREIYDAHARWNQAFCRPLAGLIPAHANDRSPERPLRIGYVSPDFHSHPVGQFLFPLLANHDRSQFQVYCFSDVRRADALTHRLRACATVWHDTASLSDEQLAELIHQERIDILIDLTMHMKGSRLLVFARKPAPVQATYLAYCGTTGVEAIDYRLTDPYLDPPGVDESVYAEKSVRLRRTYWCYQPQDPSMPEASSSAQSAGRITFGCLNAYSKINPALLTTWAALLGKVPNSRLLLHSLPGAHRDRARKLLHEHGVDPSRLEFAGFLPAAAYLHLYDRIDIGLDPFPYTGGTTTCDALWMGVPVVSLAGNTAVSRGGASILSNLDLPELVTDSRERYVMAAADLAADLPRLAELRRTLRTRMLQSPLMDGHGFARDVEDAFREVWRRACEKDL